MDRRGVVRTGAVLALAGLTPVTFGSSVLAEETRVATTTAGKVRGVSAEGVMRFLGMPYGGSTAGANRWMAPMPPTPWTDVRDASAFVGMCPQVNAFGAGSPISKFFVPGKESDAGVKQTEDCLTLNVWTRGLRDGRKRPVMVFFHGGGFDVGSGNSAMYDGTNNALHGDVVTVTVNHRLNVLGYLWLGDIGGPKYANSGNSGMLDLVAALEWVRDNIEEFGGDPENVTIFGESGGGAKVSVMLAMPEAKGLFHRAIIESGPGLRMVPRETATALAEAYLKQLGLSNGQVDQLQTLSYEMLYAAIAPATKAVPGRAGDRAGFAPVVDGVVLPRQPFDPAAPDVSDDVPVLIGTNKDEAALFTAGDPKIWDRTLTDGELKQRVAQMVGEGTADRVLSVYRTAYPKRNPAELFIAVSTGFGAWSRSITLAERKAARGKAPAYMYMFAWETPVLDGKLMAPHGLELPFVFDTIDVQVNMTDRGPAAHALARTVSQAWMTFARTGKPPWPAYTDKTRATMVFKDQSEVVRDPHASERVIWESLA